MCAIRNSSASQQLQNDVSLEKLPSIPSIIHSSQYRYKTLWTAVSFLTLVYTTMDFPPSAVLFHLALIMLL